MICILTVNVGVVAALDIVLTRGIGGIHIKRSICAVTLAINRHGTVRGGVLDKLIIIIPGVGIGCTGDRTDGVRLCAGHFQLHTINIAVLHIVTVVRPTNNTADASGTGQLDIFNDAVARTITLTFTAKTDDTADLAATADQRAFCTFHRAIGNLGITIADNAADIGRIEVCNMTVMSGRADLNQSVYMDICHNGIA